MAQYASSDTHTSHTFSSEHICNLFHHIIHLNIHTYVRTYVRTYIHTDRQTDIHTYIYIYIYICTQCVHHLSSIYLNSEYQFLSQQHVHHFFQRHLRSRIVLGDESGSPGMLSRRRGAIVNTSSGSGRATSPLLAEYSAAKAYVERRYSIVFAELQGLGAVFLQSKDRRLKLILISVKNLDIF